MTGERLTSPDEAAEMKSVLDAAADELTERGFSRDTIGAAMAGIGLGLFSAYHSPAETTALWDGVRNRIWSAARG